MENNIDDLEKQCGEYLNLLQRTKAEFENYKKRSKKEKSDLEYYANEGLLLKLLPILDNIQRSIAFMENGIDARMLRFFEGMKMVEKQFVDLLFEYGVVPFESIGKTFDPNVHQALFVVERDDIESGVVVDEIEHGYMIYDKVLRDAKVSVSKRCEDN